MFKHTLTGLLCLLTLSAAAKRNSVTVGILTGETGTFNTNNVHPYWNYGPEERIAVSFTGEINFDRNKKHLYLSIPMRLHTNRFVAEEQVYNNYTSSYYPSYYTGYTRNYTITSASLCAGIGLNYIPVGSDKIALLTNLSLMPAMEAGQFRGGIRANACGELGIGMRLLNRVSLGARVVSFLLPYSADDLSIPSHNEYNVTNLMFDLRFNIKK